MANRNIKRCSKSLISGNVNQNHHITSHLLYDHHQNQSNKQKITNVGEDVEEVEPLCIVCEVVK